MAANCKRTASTYRRNGSLSASPHSTLSLRRTWKANSGAAAAAAEGKGSERYFDEKKEFVAGECGDNGDEEDDDAYDTDDDNDDVCGNSDHNDDDADDCTSNEMNYCADEEQDDVCLARRARCVKAV